MKSNKKTTQQSNFLKPWLSTILNPSHELIKLGNSINWKSLENQFEVLFVEDKGAPAKSVRLVIGLMMLQHMYDFSDEGVVLQWVENPYWQFFYGEEQLQWDFPINPSSLTRWRKRLGQDGMNKILKESIITALNTGTVSAKSLQKTIIDTTLMEKNIAFPTDSKTQYKAIIHLVKLAKCHDIPLRQSYIPIDRKRLIKAGRYSHARQMKRAQKERQKIKTYLARLYRDIERKISENENLKALFKGVFEIAEKLLVQSKESKNKIYSFHESHVEFIAKGKFHKKYEFGCKASFVITHKEGLAIEALALHGNPYDGHTLKSALDDAEKNTGLTIIQAFMDKGLKTVCTNLYKSDIIYTND